MYLYLGLVGVISFFYYFFAVIYTRRWKSTFILFWPIAGTLHLVLLLLWKGVPGTLQNVIVTMLLVFWICFLLVEFQILHTVSCWRSKEDDVEAAYLIVLGAQVRGTYVTNSLVRRLDAALKYLQNHPNTRVVVSGGRGKGEDITEAEAMADYLISKGIPTERIIKEEKSTSTRLNFHYSAEKIGDTGQKIAVVTNDFHLYRALCLAKKEGYSMVSGVAADSNPVLYMNYMVREFFAVIWMQIRFLTA